MSAPAFEGRWEIALLYRDTYDENGRFTGVERSDPNRVATVEIRGTVTQEGWEKLRAVMYELSREPCT